MLNEAEAFESEIAIIALFGRKDLGTGCLRNLTDGGDSPRNQGALTRRRQSEAAKRRAATPEGRAHLIEADKKTDNSNRTPEHRQHLRESLLGRKASPEQILHQSLAQKGKPKPPRSEEYRRHISEAQKARWAQKKENYNV